MEDKSLREVFENITSTYPESPEKVADDVRLVAPRVLSRLAYLSSGFYVQGSWAKETSPRCLGLLFLTKKLPSRL